MPFNFGGVMSGMNRALSPSGQQTQPGQPGNLFGPSASNAGGGIYPGYNASGGGGGRMMQSNPTNPPMMGFQAPNQSQPVTDQSTGQPFVDPNQPQGGIGPSGGWMQILQQMMQGRGMSRAGGPQQNPNVMY